METWAVYFSEEFASETDALQSAQFLQESSGTVGIRVHPPSRFRSPRWAVDTLFDLREADKAPNHWLPDGCRWVKATPPILRLFEAVAT
jgi:hypothetical protein